MGVCEITDDYPPWSMTALVYDRHALALEVGLAWHLFSSARQQEAVAEGVASRGAPFEGGLHLEQLAE